MFFGNFVLMTKSDALENALTRLMIAVKSTGATENLDVLVEYRRCVELLGFDPSKRSRANPETTSTGLCEAKLLGFDPSKRSRANPETTSTGLCEANLKIDYYYTMLNPEE